MFTKSSHLTPFGMGSAPPTSSTDPTPPPPLSSLQYDEHPNSAGPSSHQQQARQQYQQRSQEAAKASIQQPEKKKERQVLRRNQACHVGPFFSFSFFVHCRRSFQADRSFPALPDFSDHLAVLALKQCRRRKLKCDSFRPICSQCARAQSSFLLSLPPGMAPPSSSEMECVCTYDEMFGPFRKNPAGAAASPGNASTGSRSGKRASIGGPSSERGVGSTSGRGRAGSIESEKDEGWSKARQLEMENRELKRQLQATMHGQQPPPHQQPLPPPPSSYPSSSHHPSYSSRYDPPSPTGQQRQSHQNPYYPSHQPPPQHQYHLPQINGGAGGAGSFPIKSNFSWSSSYQPGSNPPPKYPLSPSYQEDSRGLLSASIPNSSIRATASPPPNILETLSIRDSAPSSHRLGALELKTPITNDPASPSTSSAHSGNNNGGPSLPPLLHQTPGFQAHLHYPFVDKQQQEVFHLPPLASRFPESSSLTLKEEHEESMPRPSSNESQKGILAMESSTWNPGEEGSEWRKRVEDRSRIWALIGGAETLEQHIQTFFEVAPLLPHVFPPYSALSDPAVAQGRPSSFPSAMFACSSPNHPSALLSRVKLPIDDPNAITPALALALAALAVIGTDEGRALAAEAGRQIIFTRLMAGQEESTGSAQGRSRRAMDVAQAACILVALYHMSGRWAEFHIFSSLPLSLCDLLGIDPDRPECLPEYSISVLAPPVDEVEAEERRRTIQCSRFVGLMCGVISGRGVIGNFDYGELSEFSEIVSLNPLSLTLQSVLLLSRVDNFNRSLRPSPNSASLLSDTETVKNFKCIEGTIDTWVASLGTETGIGTGPAWKGNTGVGELLALKVLAEHARVLLYYVHLDHSTSNSQRQACLAAAQSISQSCVFASTLPVLSIPSYILHSYFLAGQVLLRFAAAAEAHRDERLLGQINQQLWAINDTLARLSGVYPVADNMHKLLDTAIREGSSVLPRSLAMHFDAALYSST